MLCYSQKYQNTNRFRKKAVDTGWNDASWQINLKISIKSQYRVPGLGEWLQKRRKTEAQAAIGQLQRRDQLKALKVHK